MIPRLIAAITDTPRSGDGIDPDFKRNFIGVQFIAIFAYAYYAVMLLPLGQYAFGAVNAAFMLAFIGMYGWLRSTGRGYAPLATIGGVAIMVSVAANTLMLGGLANSGYAFAWALLGPLGAMAFLPWQKPGYWFAFYLALALAMLLLEPIPPPPNVIPPGFLRLLTASNILGSSTLVVAFLYYAMRLVREERARADALLLNILPKEIAEVLTRETRVIADHFESASILFADIVDFTPMSSAMQPLELVELLNEVFSQFEIVAERYGIEKIKTIGDCFMAASGVPRARQDHAVALASMALEMRDLVERRTFTGGRKLRIRIGINSGPIVAGVIGTKKFIYDLWGDAVNVASRMESQGASGVIQVTAATHALIKADFDCSAAGVIDVKGKGPTEVWHVLGLRAAR